MSKFSPTLAIVGGLAAVIAQQEGKLDAPDWVTIVPVMQTTVDKDAADYGEQFKQIHLQAEKDFSRTSTAARRPRRICTTGCRPRAMPRGASRSPA